MQSGVRRAIFTVCAILATAPALHASAVAWWRFEGGCDNRTDIKTFPLHASPTARYSPDVVSKTLAVGQTRYENATSFDNGIAKEGSTLSNEDSDHINNLIATSSFTIEAFIKLHSSTPVHQFERIIGNIGAKVADGGWCLTVIKNHLVFQGVSALKMAYGSVVSDDNISMDVWHHVAVVGEQIPDGLAIHIYVDGIQQRNAVMFYRADPSGPAISTSSRAISAGAPNPLNGLIDELRISDHALDASQFVKIPIESK